MTGYLPKPAANLSRGDVAVNLGAVDDMRPSDGRMFVIVDFVNLEGWDEEGRSAQTVTTVKYHVTDLVVLAVKA